MIGFVYTLHGELAIEDSADLALVYFIPSHCLVILAPFFLEFQRTLQESVDIAIGYS